MIYILVGRMCSGKTSISKEMEKLGVKRIVTYTTRPPREGEIDGVDYHFISKEDFKDKQESGFFAETTFYYGKNGNSYYYGSAMDDYISTGEDRVIVLNPYGVKETKEKGLDVNVIWISCNDATVISRAGKRGDSQKNIKRRMQIDNEDFEWFMNHEPKLWDHEICSNLVNRSMAKDIAKRIIKNYKGE